ncbi:MAG: hypothetical protein KatS3mg087_1085 [Patescibacteria group bacterium]|nr:MAG: hypothetical protein KatS3mg087_1085 [Patescibacteria group bacterium]
MLTAPVCGVKVLEIHRRYQLASPVASTIWPPAQSYFSTRGLFFWAFPETWCRYLWSASQINVAALVDVVPADTDSCRISPGIPNLVWPEDVPPIQHFECDCLVARNMVGIARCLRIRNLIVSRCLSDRQLHRLAEYAPVRVSHNEFPRLEVWTSGWRWFDSGGSLVLDACYDRVRLFARHNFATLEWRDRRTRERVHDIVQEILDTQNSLGD